MASTASKTASTTEAPHRAGAFDIRTFIALLIGAYGIVLIVMGLVSNSDADAAKTGGLNINMWAGIGMLTVAVAFQAWAMWRPVVVPVDLDADADEAS
jgi:hypothetical protein